MLADGREGFKRKTLIVVVFVGVAVVVGLGVLAWIKVPDLYPARPSFDVANDAARLSFENARLQAIVTTRSAILASLAGLAALLTIGVNFQNARTATATFRETARAYRRSEADRIADFQQREEAAREAALDARERRVTDLYVKAVDQLGAERAPVRLGGVYALERLAQDNADRRQQVVDVLCAYLRMPFASARWLPEPPTSDANSTVQEEQEVRNAAQSVICRHLRRAEGENFWQGININLSGAVLTTFSFDGCSVDSAQFQGTRFLHLSRFRDCDFFGTCSFSGAEFVGWSTFDSSRFHGLAAFGGTNFDGMFGCCGAEFSDSALFFDAKFQAPAEFLNVHFMREASFRGASFLGECRFSGSRFESDVEFVGNELVSRMEFGPILDGNDRCPNLVSHGSADVLGASFRGQVRLTKNEFDSSEAEDSRSRLDMVSLVGANANPLLDHDWPPGVDIMYAKSGEGDLREIEATRLS